MTPLRWGSWWTKRLSEEAKRAMCFYYINLWVLCVVLPLFRDILITRWLPQLSTVVSMTLVSWHSIYVTAMSSWQLHLREEYYFTCGPNEAPSRNQVVWSFTCGPNEALGRNQVVWSRVFFTGCRRKKRNSKVKSGLKKQKEESEKVENIWMWLRVETVPVSHCTVSIFVINV